MKERNLALALVAAVAAAAFPATAIAHDGVSGHGGSQSADNGPGAADDNGQDGASTSQAADDSGSLHRGGEGGSGGNGSAQTEVFQLRGAVVSVDPASQTVVVKVAKANHGRRGGAYVGDTLTFDASSARIDVRDVNGDGSRDLSDVSAGDPVEIRADLPRTPPAQLDTPFAALRVKDRAGHGSHSKHGSRKDS